MTRYLLLAVLLSGGAAAQDAPECPPCPCDPGAAAAREEAFRRAIRALDTVDRLVDSDAEADVYDTASERPGVPRPAP